jgi:hypothetical protein
MTENSASCQTTVAIDRAQSLEHLKLLGFQDGDDVYLRCLPKSTSGDDTRFRAKNLTAKMPELPWAELERCQANGYGVYVVVNGGGHKDSDVTECHVIFYEHDNLPLDLQTNLWQTLDLPEPTLQVNTGGKSIHSYWVLSEPADPQPWRILQADLLEFADADRSIKNPSRVMRLAGTAHQGTGQLATIASSGGRLYAFQELRAIVPTQQRPNKPTRATTSSATVDIPLVNCLSRKNRDLITSGVGEGGRNAIGAALARDLIGTANYLRAEGVDFDGDPRSLFDEFCQSCNPPLDHDAEKIWRSAEKDNPAPCLSPDKITNCLAAWRGKNQPAPRGDSPTYPPATDGPEAVDDQRPEVFMVGGQIIRNLLEIERFLGQGDDPIYLQGGDEGRYLSRVLPPGSDNRSEAIEVSPDSPTLEMLNPEGLRVELNRRLKFFRYDSRSEDWQQKDCSRDIAVQFLSLGTYRHLPRLTGLSQIPLLLKTGEVVTQPGYHQPSGMLLQFDPSEFPAIPQRCTKSDAVAALAILRDWLGEFPFQTPTHESAALSALLTAVCRRLLPQAPLHAFSATAPGTGKGTLAKGISTLLMGGHPGCVPYTGDAEEFRKKVTSFLKSGQPIGLIDNVTGVLGGDVLEMVLTEPFFKDRLLGGNQTPNFSTQVTLLANGNNLRFKPDMTRRTILTVLDRETERPELHQFKRDFDEFTHQNRGRLVMAALVVLKAYIDCGKPGVIAPRLGSFGAWSDLVRSALVNLGLPDPVDTQRELRAQDEVKQQLGALLLSWRDQFGDESQTTRAAVSWAAQSHGGDLRECLLEICLERSGEFSPRRLSYYLRAHHRSVVNGMRFEQNGTDRKGFQKWSVTNLCVEPELSSASSAQVPGITQPQWFDPAEDRNTASSAERFRMSPEISDLVGGYEAVAGNCLGAEDAQKLSSAGSNNGVSMVLPMCAEDAEDVSGSSHKFVREVGY